MFDLYFGIERGKGDFFKTRCAVFSLGELIIFDAICFIEGLDNDYFFKDIFLHPLTHKLKFIQKIK